MKEIDTCSWAEFNVLALFDRIERGKGSGAGSFIDGDVPYIAASFANNGYVRDVEDLDGSLTSDGNCISLICNGNGGIGRNTYQAEPFVGSSDLQLAYHPRLNQWNGMFLVACLDKSIERYNYNFAWKRNGEAFEAETVFLPATPAGDPDWDYMEQTMLEVFALQERELDELTWLAASRGSEVDIRHWKRIPLVELFEMKNTKSITAASLVPDSGNTPYVTSQEGGNGVQMYVECPEKWLDEGGCIIIGGKTLTFSYQRQDFCSNDSHNIALYSRDAESKPESCQLFLISVLRASLEQIYSWGDSISMKRIKDESVMLPVTPSGAPDWDYMAQTMREVMAEREAALDTLQTLAAASP